MMMMMMMMMMMVAGWLQVRLRQRHMKPRRRRADERVLRRASTQRRSQRSVGRSGYAFSHEEGFGQLITSGSLMIRKHQSSRRPGISNIVAPATVAVAMAMAPPPQPPPPPASCLDDSGAPSASEVSVVTASDITTNGVPLSPVEEPTSLRDSDEQPRNPVVV